MRSVIASFFNLRSAANHGSGSTLPVLLKSATSIRAPWPTTERLTLASRASFERSGFTIRRAGTLDVCIVCSTGLCQFERMEITVTKPIEEFIAQQLAKGYADASEVTRQAFLRWMEEEEFDAEPPRLREKIEAARQGKFRPYDPQSYDTLLASADETPR